MWPQGNRGLQFKIFSSWTNIVLSIFWKPPILAQGHLLYLTPNHPLVRPWQRRVFSLCSEFFTAEIWCDRGLWVQLLMLRTSLPQLRRRAQTLHALYYYSFILFIPTFASLKILPGASSQVAVFVLHSNLIAAGGNRCSNTFHYERPGCEIQGFRSAGNLGGTWISMRVRTERLVPSN